MANDGIHDSAYQIFFTAPWKPISLRRGDALGLRALADEFAEIVAPEFSNRIRDGRWLTIVSWCLVNAYDAYSQNGGSVEDDCAGLYEWIKPLELLWVARTLHLANGSPLAGRGLVGRQRVQEWLTQCKDRNWKTNGLPPRFDMSVAQYERYRQLGPYGSYRLALRTWAGLTVDGDGWTPHERARELHGWMNKQLTASSGLNGLPSAKYSTIEKGWFSKWSGWNVSDHKKRTTLPRPRDEFRKLPESAILREVAFSSATLGGRRRIQIVNEIKAAEKRGALNSHIDLCREISGRTDIHSSLHLLEAFSALADAGMDAMEFIANSDKKKKRLSVSLKWIVAQSGANDTFEKLVKCAARWREVSGESTLAHIHQADELSKAILVRGSSIAVVRALITHHISREGGKKWFSLDGERVVFDDGSLGLQGSRYRFRLWSLCRLAAQCGMLKMPGALQGEPDEPADQMQIDEAFE